MNFCRASSSAFVRKKRIFKKFGFSDAEKVGVRMVFSRGDQDGAFGSIAQDAVLPFFNDETRAICEDADFEECVRAENRGGTDRFSIEKNPPFGSYPSPLIS